MYQYRGKLLRIIDGDTISLEVDLGFNIYTRVKFRLEEVNTPERGHPDFLQATDELLKLLIQSRKEDDYIHFTSKGLDKYGRWLIYIYGVNSVLKEKWPYNG